MKHFLLTLALIIPLNGRCALSEISSDYGMTIHELSRLLFPEYYEDIEKRRIEALELECATLVLQKKFEILSAGKMDEESINLITLSYEEIKKICSYENLIKR